MARLAILMALGAALVAVSLSHANPSTPEAKPLPGLPSYTTGYRGWIKLNPKPIPPRRTGDAHLGTKNVFSSRRKTGARYSAGTIVVKEAFRPGRKFVGLIAVMRKIKGFNPRNNDWQMIEYTRESAGARFTEIARGAICYSCHVGARDADFLCTKTMRSCP